MNRFTLGVLAGLALAATGACAAAGASPAPVARPSFPCDTAQATVEKLICSDAALAALDRELDAVYRAALAQAQGPLARPLRQAQRGWVKGRNECWKANGQDTWITASWTVNTVRGCVEAQTRLRRAELQAVWRLLPPRTVAYACQNDAANEVVVNFFDTDPATMRLERGDRTTTLWRVGGAAAGRYEGPNIDGVTQGDELVLNRLDTDTGQTERLRCRAR